MTISNTVQEHIEPAKFFGEQLRVLKPSGICLVLINLTPDNPENSKELAYSMINAHRQTSIDAINSIPHTAPGIVNEEELSQMRKRIHQKYDKRIELYDKGIKQWDTSMSLTMVLRGMKAV